MTSPLVVVQNNLVERLTGPAARAAHDLGIAVHDISSGGDGALVNALPSGGPSAGPRDKAWGPILVIGSILFVRQWAGGDADLLRWVDWIDAHYDPELWSRRLGPRFMNHAGRATTVADLIREKAPALHLRPRGGVKFMGWHVPDESHEGQTAVAGRVADAAELRRLRVEPGTRVWASPPRVIDAEVRVWMIGGRPVAWSTYRVAGEPVQRRDHPLVEVAVAAATEITAIFSPGRAHVTDVALVDGEWRLVEYNPIHAAGWYDADPAVIIAAWFEYHGTRG